MSQVEAPTADTISADYLNNRVLNAALRILRTATTILLARAICGPAMQALQQITLQGCPRYVRWKGVHYSCLQLLQRSK